MYVAGSKNRTSRVTHVVITDDASSYPGIGNSIRWTDKNLAQAACGETVHPTRSTLKESNEVCLKCRKALGWPFIVTWEQHGHTITTDFNRK